MNKVYNTLLTNTIYIYVNFISIHIINTIDWTMTMSLNAISSVNHQISSAWKPLHNLYKCDKVNTRCNLPCIFCTKHISLPYLFSRALMHGLLYISIRVGIVYWYWNIDRLMSQISISILKCINSILKFYIYFICGYELLKADSPVAINVFKEIANTADSIQY